MFTQVHVYLLPILGMSEFDVLAGRQKNVKFCQCFRTRCRPFLFIYLFIYEILFSYLVNLPRKLLDMTWWNGNKQNKLISGFINMLAVTTVTFVVCRLLATCLPAVCTAVVHVLCKECTETFLRICYGKTNTSQATGFYSHCAELTQMLCISLSDVTLFRTVR